MVYIYCLKTPRRDFAWPLNEDRRPVYEHLVAEADAVAMLAIPYLLVDTSGTTPPCCRSMPFSRLCGSGQRKPFFPLARVIPVATQCEQNPYLANCTQEHLNISWSKGRGRCSG